jgi:toxin ParE1/3/4
MLPLRWSEEAIADLEQIGSYVAQFNMSAAMRLQDMIEEAVLPLSNHPYLGRGGRKDGTREFVVHPSYIVIYRVDADYISITAVLHTRRQYP